MLSGNARAAARLMVGLLFLATTATTATTAGGGAAHAQEARAGSQANEEPAHIKLSAGYKGDIFAERKSGGIFAFEYRSGPDWDFWHIRPSFGVAGTTDSSLYGWAGLNIDIFFGRRIVLTPTTGIGAYARGDGQDLGSVLEFRNGAELAWRFDSRARLGVGLHYLSNYGIGDTDPGIGVVTLFYAHPLGAILPP